MMKEQEWPNQTMINLKLSQKDYMKRAYLEAALRLYQEQAKLLEIKRGQLDAGMWNPSNWTQS